MSWLPSWHDGVSTLVSANQWMFLTRQCFVMRFWRAEPGKQRRTLDVSKAGAEKMKRGHQREESCLISMFCPLEGHFMMFYLPYRHREGTSPSKPTHDDLNWVFFVPEPNQTRSTVLSRHNMEIRTEIHVKFQHNYGNIHHQDLLWWFCWCLFSLHPRHLKKSSTSKTNFCSRASIGKNNNKDRSIPGDWLHNDTRRNIRLWLWWRNILHSLKVVA